jgi:hypothetical protein
MTRNPIVTVVIWNAQWKTGRRLAPRLRAYLWQHEPDVVVLTEAHLGFVPEGHTISSDADYGYPLLPRRRKVVLWAKNDWRCLDQLGSPTLPSGRFVSGMTETTLGPIKVVGVCIPWPSAHVRTGMRNRRPWDDHLSYLQGLQPLLHPPGTLTLVAGDFNQYIPRKRAPDHAYKKLLQSLAFMNVPTAGAIEPSGIQLIDHLGHSSDLTAVSVQALSNIDGDGTILSDHVGVKVVLGLATPEVQQSNS